MIQELSQTILEVILEANEITVYTETSESVIARQPFEDYCSQKGYTKGHQEMWYADQISSVEGFDYQISLEDLDTNNLIKYLAEYDTITTA